MTITLRTTDQTGATNKGSDLTYAELDANFVDLMTRTVNVKNYGAVGDGVTDDTAAIQAAINAISARQELLLPGTTGYYKILTTLEVLSKSGCVLDFNNQQINAGSFSAPAYGLHFTTLSEARLGPIYLIGHLTNTTVGVFFDASSGHITIHGTIGPVHVFNCAIGIQVGPSTGYQVSDNVFDDLYGSACSTGVKITGINTFNKFGRIAAYLNTAIGVHLEEGNGVIEYLDVAVNPTNLYFGHTDGTLGSNLSRWDINGGYSEESGTGWRFIDSAKCTDTNPFIEQVHISGMRITPFTGTNASVIRWRLNGDLTLRDCEIAHGQQSPVIEVDHNTTYNAPSVRLDNCVVDCTPHSSPQVYLKYTLTDNRQRVEIDARYNNAQGFWHNDGGADGGLIKKGIYTDKRKKFEAALRSLSGLQGAWDLSDLPSGTCKNIVLGAPSLTLSAAMENGDFHLDDGLIGFGRTAGATEKTLSSSSATFSAGSYTFGCIMRSFTGTDVVDATNIGGALGIRIGVGTGFAQLRVGATNATAVPASDLDPHLVIGRYTSATRIEVNASNLRTGNKVTANSVAGIPAFGALTWSNGITLTNTSCVRGYTFLFNRVLTDAEIQMLQQSAEQLTDSWRLF